MRTAIRIVAESFLGGAPAWFKRAIFSFLLLNPLLFLLDPYIAGWALVLEFIFTLAMALRCYPLQPGGLLAIEASAIGMTSTDRVFEPGRFLVSSNIGAPLIRLSYVRMVTMAVPYTIAMTVTGLLAVMYFL